MKFYDPGKIRCNARCRVLCDHFARTRGTDAAEIGLEDPTRVHLGTYERPPAKMASQRGLVRCRLDMNGKLRPLTLTVKMANSDVSKSWGLVD
jgi:hypothetical protein